MAVLYSRMRNSLSGNFAAKSSAAFSSAAGSVVALAVLNASNSGCVLACGGRLPSGTAGAACAAPPCWAEPGAAPGCPPCCPAPAAAPACPPCWLAGGFCDWLPYPACAKANDATARIAHTTATRFMLSPSIATSGRDRLLIRILLLGLCRNGGLIGLLQSLLRRRLGLRKRTACAQRCTVLPDRRFAIFLQIENAPEINMRPRHYLRFLRDAQSALKVISSSLNIAVHGRDLRQDKQRSSRIFALLVQSLLRQLLRRRRIARRQPLLGRDQQLFRSASRNVNNFRSGAAGELHLPCSFSFAANINRIQHVAIRIAEPNRALLEFGERIIEVAGKNETLSHGSIDGFIALRLGAFPA